MATDRTPLDEATLLGPDARRSPDMEILWARLVAEDAGVPSWLDLPPAEARALQDGLARRWNATLPAVDKVERLDGVEGLGVPAQIVVPPDAAPGCILFLHGGGWAFGNLETHQRFMRLLAIATKRRVLGIDYRLAPNIPIRRPWMTHGRPGAGLPDRVPPGRTSTVR